MRGLPEGTSLRRAAIWMVGVLLAITVLAIAGREAMREVTAPQLVLWRNIVALPLILGWIVATRVPIASLRTRVTGLHLWRNAAHAFGQLMWFYALAAAPLALVFAIEFTYPLWVVLLAPLVLGEPLSMRRVLAAALGFLGILVVLRPGAAPLEFGVVAACLCALGYAFSTMATKQLSRTESALQVVLYMAIVQAGLAAVPALVDFRWPSPVAWGWVGLACLAGLCAHVCMTRAMALADASVIAPIDFLRLPLVALVGVLAYGEGVDPWVLLGGAIILLANASNMGLSLGRIGWRGRT
jgi:drug/metabolite transporter (DMT)-like permease